METNKTTENNKLIGEFMEIENLITEKQFLSYEHEPHNPTIIELLKYHNSWDALIPVIKRIREIMNLELPFSLYDKVRNYEQRLNPYTYDIDSIYKGVIEFIKWYNQNKE